MAASSWASRACASDSGACRQGREIETSHQHYCRPMPLFHKASTSPPMHLRVFTVAALAVAVTVTMSCASDSTTTGRPTTSAAGPASGIDLDAAPPIPSEIEGFPVPDVAILENLELGVGALANDTVMDNADYRLPPGVTVSDVRQWYQAVQPQGEDFGSWSWCESVPLGNSVYYWWAQPGTDQMLGIFIAEGSPVEGMPSTSLRVTSENSGPC